MSDAVPVDLARLVAIIAEEVIAASRRPASRCACHSVLDDCCPTRLQGVIDAGAVRLGVHASGGAPTGVAGYIDHTLLKPDASRRDIEQLCREAAEFKFATVCVNPVWAAFCASLLRSTPVAVCTVVGFPLGATTADVKQYETRRVIYDGAREVDMVINIGALKSGDVRTVERDIEAVTAPCRDAGVTSKVIIEAAFLTDEEKVTACTLAKAAGADFVKTSTGFGPGGATVADVALMRRVVGAEMGVKAAGGVKDLEALKAMVAAGASRVGASAGVRIVQQAKGGPAAAAPAGYKSTLRNWRPDGALRNRRRDELRCAALKLAARPPARRPALMLRRAARKFGPTTHLATPTIAGSLSTRQFREASDGGPTRPFRTLQPDLVPAVGEPPRAEDGVRRHQRSLKSIAELLKK